jgi:uncharacterized protein YqeY
MLSTDAEYNASLAAANAEIAILRQQVAHLQAELSRRPKHDTIPDTIKQREESAKLWRELQERVDRDRNEHPELWITQTFA